ncbi:MAG: hypothetical protein WD250_09850 [Egibacteraceae bacterium]
MVTVLVVPDGAADPLGPDPTCLEAARTPQLDRLAGQGRLELVATIPAGLAPGTEVGLPSLLGVRLDAPLARGLLEAAAAAIAVEAEQGAWRLDRPVGETADAAAMDTAVRPLGARVHPLAGHRTLLVGPRRWGDAPPGPHHSDRPLDDLATGVFATIARLTCAWPWGRLPVEEPANVPTLLGRPVTVVAAGGAPDGIARLLGCQVTDAQPESVTADAGADQVVVVHRPGPDDAAHARNRAAKIAALEAVDTLIGRLAAIVVRRGGALIVCPDHGCDPATGRHTAGPVPALVWRSTAAGRAEGAVHGGWARGPEGAAGSRLTERAVATLEAVPARVLLAAREAVA